MIRTLGYYIRKIHGYRYQTAVFQFRGLIVGNPDRQSRGKGLASLIQIVRPRKDYVFGLGGQHSILKALIFRAE